MSDDLTDTFPPMVEGQTEWELSGADFCPEGPSDVVPVVNPSLSYRTEGWTEPPPMTAEIWDNTEDAPQVRFSDHLPLPNAHGRDSTERDPLISPHRDDLKSRHAYHHPNGGGLCFGFDHDLSADTYFSGNGIHGKTITSKATITDSWVYDSTLIDANVNRSLIDDCILRRAAVTNVRLVDVVVDDAILIGPWSLQGNARIHRGEWSRPPRFLQIETENLSVGITECTDGCANISSRCHKVEDWIRLGPRLGRMLGWSEKEIEMAREFLESLK